LRATTAGRSACSARQFVASSRVRGGPVAARDERRLLAAYRRLSAIPAPHARARHRNRHDPALSTSRTMTDERPDEYTPFRRYVDPKRQSGERLFRRRPSALE